MKRGDENELERNVPVSVYRVPVSVYRVPVSREGGRKQTAQVCHGDGRRKKSKTGEDGSKHTAQVGPGDVEERRAKKGMNLN